MRKLHPTCAWCRGVLLDQGREPASNCMPSGRITIATLLRHSHACGTLKYRLRPSRHMFSRQLATQRWVSHTRQNSDIRIICLQLCVASLLLSPSLAAWRVIHPQTPDAAGSRSSPSIRYSHTCNTYKGNMVTTHGYYYDRGSSSPTWLSDTWAMDLASAPHAWRLLSDHASHHEAHAAYSSGRAHNLPCGRFGHASAIVGDALYMYGGHDGGYSRTNRHDYQPGNDFAELWRFNLLRKTWSLVVGAVRKVLGRAILVARGTS